MDCEALEDFESPEYGKIGRGDTLALDASSARDWCVAGLVREAKKKVALLRGVKEAADEQ